MNLKITQNLKIDLFIRIPSTNILFQLKHNFCILSWLITNLLVNFTGHSKLDRFIIFTRVNKLKVINQTFLNI